MLQWHRQQSLNKTFNVTPKNTGNWLEFTSNTFHWHVAAALGYLDTNFGRSACIDKQGVSNMLCQLHHWNKAHNDETIWVKHVLTWIFAESHCFLPTQRHKLGFFITASLPKTSQALLVMKQTLVSTADCTLYSTHSCPKILYRHTLLDESSFWHGSNVVGNDANLGSPHCTGRWIAWETPGRRRSRTTAADKVIIVLSFALKSRINLDKPEFRDSKSHKTIVIQSGRGDNFLIGRRVIHWKQCLQCKPMNTCYNI